MAMIDFTGRTVIVTGAGGGLGRTYALEIARRGGFVIVNDLGGDVEGLNGSPSMADQVVSEIEAAGGWAVASYDSVTSKAGAAAIVRAALDSSGRVDALINNAGNLRNAWFEDFAEADRDSLFAVHLAGAFNVTQAVWPHLKRQAYGRVVFTSSGAGMFGNQTQSGYGAAKAGVTGLMNVLAQEGAPYGILCNALLPNAASRMGEKIDPTANADLGRVAMGLADRLLPEFITPMAVYLASEACTTTHDLYSVLGGRVARAFIGVTEGWIGPSDAPPTVEQIQAHIDDIRDIARGVHVPASLTDEFHIVVSQFGS